MTRRVAITGVGLVSCQGVGRAAHAALGPPRLDETSFAPFPIHPLPPLPEWEASIPRREWRQMENWQRLGAYAAGLAIADADARALAPEMDLMVAAGGGERDIALDTAILSALPALPEEAREAHIARALAEGLRPTLFLAQLSNLMAGSISILHGVGGSSRTLMGEEAAGAEALRIAHARIAAGTSRAVLVGAALIAGRWDEIITYAPVLHRGPFAPVAERQGMIRGSMAAFLLLEPLEEALARGAAPLALLCAVATAAGAPEERAARLAALPGGDGALSAAPFAGPGVAGALCIADSLGHGMEAAFPMAVAIGALRVAAGEQRLGVQGFGHALGEFAAVLEAVR
ncbi:MAG: beta-ketoacyl synthase N-terminal-like domain-containing protein [Rhodovarius sp.]|nr:beta-ketoacyl synthase N-terminal-like domain-containing protein [Rhodovarius sp.]